MFFILARSIFFPSFIRENWVAPSRDSHATKNNKLLYFLRKYRFFSVAQIAWSAARLQCSTKRNGLVFFSFKVIFSNQTRVGVVIVGGNWAVSWIVCCGSVLQQYTNQRSSEIIILRITFHTCLWCCITFRCGLKFDPLLLRLCSVF
jgi:hypothetical protein